MLFRHPCDTCLVQACCNRICDKYKKHIKISNFLPYVFMILSIQSFIYIVVKIIKTSPDWYLGLFLGLIFWIICAIGSFIFIKCYDDDEIKSTGLIIFIGALSPLIFTGLLIELVWQKSFRQTDEIHYKRLNIK